MLISNNMDRDQAPRNVGPDLRSILFDNKYNFQLRNCLVCIEWLDFWGYRDLSIIQIVQELLEGTVYTKSVYTDRKMNIVLVSDKFQKVKTLIWHWIWSGSTPLIFVWMAFVRPDESVAHLTRTERRFVSTSWYPVMATKQKSKILCKQKIKQIISEELGVKQLANNQTGFLPQALLLDDG